MAAYRAAHPYASATELAKVRAAERGTDPHQVPYFDLTVDVVKSVSVLHASYRVAARQARERGDQDQAAALDARADEIEAALLDAAREAVAWLERHATYTRTGHHSARTGEWRDGDGLVASVFLHHISRDGDPHLHVHIAVWNRVQRADRADEKWRTLDSRSLHNQRLAVAPVTDRIVETRLSALGYAMVPREDGNGAEVGGVSQDVMDLFSSRSRALTPELKALIGQYQKTHGKPPSKRTIWLLGQQAAQNTRRTKAEARRTVAGQAGTAEPTAGAAAGRLGSADDAAGSAGPVGGAPRGGPVRRRARRACTGGAGRCGQAQSRADRRRRGATAPRGLVDGSAPVRGAPGAAGAAAGRRRRGAGHRGGQAGRLRPGRDRGHPGHRAGPHRRDQPGGAGLRRRQHLPAAERGTVLHPGPPGHRTADPHRRHTDRAAAGHRRAGPGGRRAHRAERRAARRRGHDAHRHHGDDRAGRRGRGGQEPHHGRVRPAVDHVHRPAGDRAGHGHQRGPGPGQRGPGRVLQHRRSSSARSKAPTSCAGPCRCIENDVLVLDEASQLSTTDLAMVQEAARAAGARLVLVGDTEQLGAVEAGGMFRLLAREVPCAELHEVRRFDAAWEAGASVRLRAGDFTAYADYDRHGRMRGADQDAAMDRAAGMWLADHLRGKNVLLLAGSNSEAAELSRRVQAKLIQLGTVQRPQAALSDGNQAGTGDLIRARLNTKINAGGRELTNRDTLKITGWHGPHAQVRRRELDGTWTSPFLVPRAYLADSAELDYAGNTHVGQGRTVDTAHLLVTGTLSRRSLYVGLTRGRESNTAHIVTGNTAPPGHPPYQQASPESVVKAIMDRDDADLSATEQIRHAQDWTGGTGHLLTLWSAAVRQLAVPADRRADQSPAHRIRSLAVRPGTLPPSPPAAAPRRPARRARHRRRHRPDHRRADGRRPVHLQRPARPPPAA